MARIAFELDSGDVLEKMIRDSEVIPSNRVDPQDVTFVQDSLPDYAVYGVCYTLAMIFSNNSLKHVNYPTQVLAKSCKMIPVLVAGTLFGSGFWESPPF